MASNTICKHANTHAAFNTSFLHRLVVVLMNGVGDILLRSLSTHHVNVAVVVEVKDTVAVVEQEEEVIVVVFGRWILEENRAECRCGVCWGFG